MPVTAAEMDAIAAKAAQKVWAMMLKNPTGPEEVRADELLWYTNQQAHAATQLWEAMLKQPDVDLEVPAGDLQWYTHLEGSAVLAAVNEILERVPPLPPAA